MRTNLNSSTTSGTLETMKIPNGKVGEKFLKELSHLFRSYAEGSSLESVALTAAFLFPILVLQKPSPKLKSKEADSPPQSPYDSMV